MMSQAGYLMLAIAFLAVGNSAVSVSLRGDDAKESSSEAPRDDVAVEISGMNEDDNMSDDSCVPPIAAITKPLPSGRIWGGVAESVSSGLTGDTERQKDILELEDLDVGYKGDSLLIAAEINDADAVQRILDKPSTDVNLKDEQEKDALYIASELGWDDIVQKLLIHVDVDINTYIRTSDGSTSYAFMNACGFGYVRMVQLFLEQQEKEISLENFTNSLCVACLCGHVGMLPHFLKHPKMDVNMARTTGGATPLIMASQSGHLELVEKLLERKEIEVNKADIDGCGPLFQACQNGHLEIVENLLERNEIEVNKAKNNDTTPLFMACQEGHLEIVEKLLERNEIEVNKAKTDTGSTPLFMACQQGHLEIVEKLLERNEIEVNKARTDTGSTPLFIACQKGNLEIVKTLLERSTIDINKTSKGTNTALTTASGSGHLEVVQALLEHPGTDVNTYLERAIKKASSKGHDAIVILLQKHATTK